MQAFFNDQKPNIDSVRKALEVSKGEEARRAILNSLELNDLIALKQQIDDEKSKLADPSPACHKELEAKLGMSSRLAAEAAHCFATTPRFYGEAFGLTGEKWMKANSILNEHVSRHKVYLAEKSSLEMLSHKVGEYIVKNSTNSLEQFIAVSNQFDHAILRAGLQLFTSQQLAELFSKLTGDDLELPKDYSYPIRVLKEVALQEEMNEMKRANLASARKS